MRRIFGIILIFLISFCGGSEVSNNDSLVSSTITTVVDSTITTQESSTTSSTTTTNISDATSSDNKNKYENINSKFIFDKDSYPSVEWSQSFELIELDKSVSIILHSIKILIFLLIQKLTLKKYF